MESKKKKKQKKNRGQTNKNTVLPHHSRLSTAAYDDYQDRSDFLSNQGAYVYRNGRLMAWGNCFPHIAFSHGPDVLSRFDR